MKGREAGAPCFWEKLPSNAGLLEESCVAQWDFSKNQKKRKIKERR